MTLLLPKGIPERSDGTQRADLLPYRGCVYSSHSQAPDYRQSEYNESYRHKNKKRTCQRHSPSKWSMPEYQAQGQHTVSTSMSRYFTNFVHFKGRQCVSVTKPGRRSAPKWACSISNGEFGACVGGEVLRGRTVLALSSVSESSNAVRSLTTAWLSSSSWENSRS